VPFVAELPWLITRLVTVNSTLNYRVPPTDPHLGLAPCRPSSKVPP
jgi:hypothetical protein